MTQRKTMCSINIFFAAIGLLGFTNRAAGDSAFAAVVLEFANGTKTPGHLAGCTDQIYWSDKISQPYIQLIEGTHTIVWKQLMMAEMKRMDFLPLTAAERERVGTNADWASGGKLPPSLVKANVTFKDGEVRKSMFIILDPTWETKKETGDFHHSVLRAMTIEKWSCSPGAKY